MIVARVWPLSKLKLGPFHIVGQIYLLKVARSWPLSHFSFRFSQSGQRLAAPVRRRPGHNETDPFRRTIRFIRSLSSGHDPSIIIMMMVLLGNFPANFKISGIKLSKVTFLGLDNNNFIFSIITTEKFSNTF